MSHPVWGDWDGKLQPGSYFRVIKITEHKRKFADSTYELVLHLELDKPNAEVVRCDPSENGTWIRGVMHWREQDWTITSTPRWRAHAPIEKKGYDGRQLTAWREDVFVISIQPGLPG
jgi:hypothetical protein